MTDKKAVILAGGKGTRLYPITSDLPKPLVPILNTPVITHTLKALAGAGIRDAAITLSGDTEKIREYLDGAGTCGVRTEYYTESEPRGTAGCVLDAMEFCDGDFIVLGGDVLFDFDLDGAFEFHKKTGAVVTVIVSHSDEPCRYGNLCYDKSGKITKFYEKPEWKNVKSDIISTGIYVLSPRIFDFIPRGIACDFAKDVFPKLDGGALYAYDAGGYFLDIGTPEAYLKANFDAARGLIKTVAPSHDIENVISPKAKVTRGAKVSGSVIMDGAVICEGTSVYNSIVCRGAVVQKNAYISNAVVPPHTSVSGESSPLGRIKLENARVSGETADEISPDSSRAKHVFTGTVNAPYGAAKTLGELISRGAEDMADGVKLDFDGGSATLVCTGKNSVEISASAENPEYAEKIFSYAENGLENLF